MLAPFLSAATGEVLCVGHGVSLDDHDRAIPGCLVLDVRMPGMSGLELQDRLDEQGIDIPIIFITGNADVPMAIRAIRNGAIEFLEKPFREQVLLERIRTAIERDTQARRALTGQADIAARLASLTHREAQVLDLLVAGKANKTIATKLCFQADAAEAEGQQAKMLEEARATGVPYVLVSTVIHRGAAIRIGRRKTTFSKDVKGPVRIEKRKVETVSEFVAVDQPVNRHCPSVEVLFDSVAQHAGRQAVGILLTGMGADGAKGLLNMRNRGAVTIAQDRDSCVVYGMPKVAVELGAVEHSAAPSAIPSCLLQALRRRNPRVNAPPLDR